MDNFIAALSDELTLRGSGRAVIGRAGDLALPRTDDPEAPSFPLREDGPLIPV
jgi:hypothetical protein